MQFNSSCSYSGLICTYIDFNKHYSAFWFFCFKALINVKGIIQPKTLYFLIALMYSSSTEEDILKLVAIDLHSICFGYRMLIILQNIFFCVVMRSTFRESKWVNDHFRWTVPLSINSREAFKNVSEIKGLVHANILFDLFTLKAS